MPDENQVSFVKTRFDYCKALYELERKRHEELEKKAQFYLSFITIFIGATFIKIDFLESLESLVSQPDIPSFVRLSLYVIMCTIGLSTITVLVLILASIRVQKYRDPAFKDIKTIFKESAKYNEEIVFIRDISGLYSIAVEENKAVNDRKARLVKLAAISVLFTIILLALLIIIIAIALTY